MDGHPRSSFDKLRMSGSMAGYSRSSFDKLRTSGCIWPALHLATLHRGRRVEHRRYHPNVAIMSGW
jgi:hypothetical protein